MEEGASLVLTFAIGALSGALTCMLFFDGKRRKGALVSAGCTSDDDCQSLYYDYSSLQAADGGGFPESITKALVKQETIDRMTTIHDEYRMLPGSLYKAAVENLIVVCVDVLAKTTDNKLILFLRRDKPADKIWWWPGGRMFRGETFFDTAIRKINDETGGAAAKSSVKPLGIVNVWNTFFPDSAWDGERLFMKRGTQTVNVTVVVSIDASSSDVSDRMMATKAGAEAWAVAGYKFIRYGDAAEYDKYISLNVRQAMEKGLL